MSSLTYRRSQVGWALWRSFTFNRYQQDEPPQIFETRIKRLLDLDRELPPLALGIGPDDQPRELAFSAALSGKGQEAAYSAIDVFCLGVALDLVDVGFKQGEVVMLMRHLRPHLEPWLPNLIKRPSLIDRQRVLARHHPDLPVIERAGRAALADARVFMCLNRVEISEVLTMDGTARQNSARRAGDEPLLLVPHVCAGMSDVSNYLDQLLPLHRRTVLIVEIAALAQACALFLDQAPVTKRGRRKQDQGDPFFEP